MDWSSSQIWSITQQCILITFSHCRSIKSLPHRLTIASWTNNHFLPQVTLLPVVELFLQLRTALRRCSSLIIPRRTSCLHKGKCFSSPKIQFYHMKLAVELHARLICEMPYGDVLSHCVSSASNSAGGHNELLWLCVIFIACNGMQ